jgi:hypothetical protein
MRYMQAWKDMPLAEVEAENQANLEATIRRAVEVGVTHIETARGYGSSERQLGQILPTFPREKLIVQTKLGPNDSAQDFRSQFHESLARLNLDYVDLLAIHGINDDHTLHQSVRPGGCLEMARRLQAEGKARHIGFSTHGPNQLITRAIQTDAFGGFDYVNLHWYYIYQRNWPSVVAARQRDMGVFIISPTDKGGMLQKPSEKMSRLTAPYHPIIFNDLYCLDRPEVHTLSLGAARPSDFDLHLEAISLFPQRKQILAPILERLRAAMVEAFGTDFPDRFLEGIPEWHETPGEANLPIVLWLYTVAKAWDLTDFARMRYNLLNNGGHWFPGRAVESFDQLDFPKLLKRSPFADRIPGMLREASVLLKGEQKKRLSEGG